PDADARSRARLADHPDDHRHRRRDLYGHAALPVHAGRLADHLLPWLDADRLGRVLVLRPGLMRGMAMRRSIQPVLPAVLLALGCGSGEQTMLTQQQLKDPES